MFLFTLDWSLLNVLGKPPSHGINPQNNAELPAFFTMLAMLAGSWDQQYKMVMQCWLVEKIFLCKNVQRQTPCSSQRLHKYSVGWCSLYCLVYKYYQFTKQTGVHITLYTVQCTLCTHCTGSSVNWYHVFRGKCFNDLIFILIWLIISIMLSSAWQGYKNSVEIPIFSIFLTQSLSFTNN